MGIVLKRLANGEKLDAITRELSGDKARQRGSLVWKTRGSPLKAFEDAAYSLGVPTVDRPVYTNTAAKISEGLVSAVLRCRARYSGSLLPD